MKQYALTCCSTADLTREHFLSRDISYVCFHFILDGVQYEDDLGATIPFEEFYQRLADGADASTAQVNVAEFIAFFEPFLQDGQDILHVSLSSGLSGAYSAACVAREELVSKYPDRRITVVDSRGASSGYGLLMELLADYRDAGADYDAACAFAEANKLHIHHWFFSTDLSSYIKGGRITRTAFVVGTILGICPLLNMDAAGHLIPREKIRTKRKVKQAIVNKMKEFAKGGTDYSGKCFISQSACYEDARDVADMIEAAFPNLDGKVLINYVGTTIGSHTGRGTVALFFEGDERTD